MKEFLPSLLIITLCAQTVSALTCIQCDTRSGWYTEEEEQDRRVEECQAGIVLPTDCHNRTATHCIVSWYRSGGSKERTVTERKCGGVEDVTGCTLYNSKISRRVRHLLNKDNQKEYRRETATLFVEVCSESCPVGDCVNSAVWKFTLPVLFAPFVYRFLF